MNRTALVTRLAPSSLRTRQVLLIAMLLLGAPCFPSTDPFLVVHGRIVSTAIKYSTIGKQTGTGYTGTITVHVLETLKSEGSRLKPRRDLVLRVNEQNKRPTWEAAKHRDLIFAVEPIPGTGQFRAVSVVSADPEVLGRVRQRDFANLKEVVDLLEHYRDENHR